MLRSLCLLPFSRSNYFTPTCLWRQILSGPRLGSTFSLPVDQWSKVVVNHPMFIQVLCLPLIYKGNILF